jgi:hypothetical protein
MSEIPRHKHITGHYTYRRFTCSECGGLLEVSSLASNPPVREYACHRCGIIRRDYPDIELIKVDMHGFEGPDGKAITDEVVSR